MTAVRLATTEDIGVLTKMRFDFSQEHNTSITAADYDEFVGRCGTFLSKAITEASRWRIWVAEVDGQIVAHMFVQLVEKVPRPGKISPPFGYVTNVYTLPNHCGKGIGGLIHREIQRWSSENKLDFLIVWPSEKSVEFYKRNGFSPCKEALEWFW